MVTMDLGGGGAAGAGVGGEVVDLEAKVPAGWERRLDLLSGKTFLTPHRHQATQDGHQDLNLPPTASTAAAVTSTSAAFCTLDMVRYALERATAARSATSPDTSSSSLASTSSSSSSLGKRSRSPPSNTASPAANPAMRACACPSCFTYVLIAEADPWCPRCASKVPPLPSKPAAHSSGKKPRIDLNADADETE
uniref:GIR1-like zinc ribbon domain-containing protein n=1 Tax=Aegilops tauschii TaxID=37682 RepID=M8CQQ9_AEGTA